MEGLTFPESTRMKKTVLMLSAAGIAVAWSGFASQLPGETIPGNKAPTDIAMAAVPEPMVTGSIPRSASIAPMNGDLKSGLDALSAKQPQQALAVRNGMSSGSLDRHILTWAIVTSGQPGVPSAEIAAAARELTGWPGLASLRANSERALFIESPPAGQVLAAFGDTRPETAEGAFLLSRALVATGSSAQAAKVVRNVWRTQTLDKSFEDKFLGAFSGLLTPADHKARMDLLLYTDRVAQAKRFGDLGQAPSLYSAWAAVAARSPKAAALLASVPPICLPGSNISAGRTNTTMLRHFSPRYPATATHWSIPANGGTSSASSAEDLSTRATTRQHTRSLQTAWPQVRRMSVRQRFMPAGMRCVA
jgi:soluble lytic murein transglycosylase